MSIVVGTNSYNTEAELTDYATARGITLVGAPAVLLINAMDWLELRPFSGSKTDPDQALEFPRNDETDVPDKIKTAQLVAALLIDSGVDLMAPIEQRVLSERVGQVSVSYSGRGNQSTLYPQLMRLLSGFLSGSGMTIKIQRG